MEHVVFFTGPGGAAQFRRTQSLEEAVRVVEYLRNVDGVEDAQVFSLTAVPLSFRAVYRVEIGAPAAAEAPAPLPPLPPMPDLSVDTAQPEAEAPAEPVAEAAAPAPVAEAPAEPVEAPEPVLAAVPSEPYEAAAEAPSNGKPAARGMGFFSR